MLRKVETKAASGGLFLLSPTQIFCLALELAIHQFFNNYARRLLLSEELELVCDERIASLAPVRNEPTDDKHLVGNVTRRPDFLVFRN